MTCKLLAQRCGVEVISSKQTGGVGVVITGGGGGGGHTSEQMRPSFDPADVRVVSVRRHFTDLHRMSTIPRRRALEINKLPEISFFSHLQFILMKI